MKIIQIEVYYGTSGEMLYGLGDDGIVYIWSTLLQIWDWHTTSEVRMNHKEKQEDK